MMTYNQIEILGEYFKNDQSKLKNYLSDQFQESEPKEIDSLWKSQVHSIISKNKKIKLIILGEAPLSVDKYFYNKPGGFLSGLRAYYNSLIINEDEKIQNSNFSSYLTEKGILLLDLFKYPLPSKLYKNYYTDFIDNVYLTYKMNEIKGLITSDTKIIFRYKMLIKRKLHLIPALKSIKNKYLMNPKEPTSIFSQERPNQIIRDSITKYL